MVTRRVVTASNKDFDWKKSLFHITHRRDHTASRLDISFLSFLLIIVGAHELF